MKINNKNIKLLLNLLNIHQLKVNKTPICNFTLSNNLNINNNNINNNHQIKILIKNKIN